MLSPQELQHGYWGALRLAGSLPSPISHPSEYDGGERLTIACNHYNLKQWCETLPKLKVKTLVFECRVNQTLFDSVAQVEGLEELSIKWSGVRSLASITRCNALRALDIGSSPSATGLTHLCELLNLRSLRLENLKEAKDLTLASGILALEEFGVSGSVWSEQKIDNLWPLKQLSNLQVLWLINSRIMHGGLEPLYQLPKLITLYTSRKYFASEFAALRKSLPTLKFGTPFNE